MLTFVINTFLTQIQEESVLAKILVEALGPELLCGEAICYTVEDQEAYAEFLKMDAASYPSASASASAPTSKPIPAVSVPAAAAPAAVHAISDAVSVPVGNQKFSPAARHLLQSSAIDSSGIIGTRSLTYFYLSYSSIYLQFLEIESTISDHSYFRYYKFYEIRDRPTSSFSPIFYYISAIHYWSFNMHRFSFNFLFHRYPNLKFSLSFNSLYSLLFFILFSLSSLPSLLFLIFSY